MGATLQTDVYLIEKARPTPDTMYEFVGMTAKGEIVRVNYEKPYGRSQSPDDVLSFLNRFTAERFLAYLKAQGSVDDAFYVSKQTLDADVYYLDFNHNKIHIGITRYEGNSNYLGCKDNDNTGD